MKTDVVAVILAGGQARRLGGRDKALLSINSRRLIDRCIASLAPYCRDIALSVRPENTWAQKLGLTLLYDRPSPNKGPLGGIAAALHWSHSQTPRPDWVITTPVDLPFIPEDLVEKLTCSDADVVVAYSGGQTHHPVAAWKPSLSGRLGESLNTGTQAVHKFQSTCKVVTADWEASPFDPFFNINTPDDILTAETIERNMITPKAVP